MESSTRSSDSSPADRDNAHSGPQSVKETGTHIPLGRPFSLDDVSQLLLGMATAPCFLPKLAFSGNQEPTTSFYVEGTPDCVTPTENPLKEFPLHKRPHRTLVSLSTKHIEEKFLEYSRDGSGVRTSERYTSFMESSGERRGAFAVRSSLSLPGMQLGISFGKTSSRRCLTSLDATLREVEVRHGRLSFGRGSDGESPVVLENGHTERDNEDSRDPKGTSKNTYDKAALAKNGGSSIDGCSPQVPGDKAALVMNGGSPIDGSSPQVPGGNVEAQEVPSNSTERENLKKKDEPIETQDIFYVSSVLLGGRCVTRETSKSTEDEAALAKNCGFSIGGPSAQASLELSKKNVLQSSQNLNSSSREVYGGHFLAGDHDDDLSSWAQSVQNGWNLRPLEQALELRSESQEVSKMLSEVIKLRKDVDRLLGSIDEHVNVLVLGPTGSGKSSLIQHCRMVLGEEDLAGGPFFAAEDVGEHVTKRLSAYGTCDGRLRFLDIVGLTKGLSKGGVLPKASHEIIRAAVEGSLLPGVPLISWQNKKEHLNSRAKAKSGDPDQVPAAIMLVIQSTQLSSSNYVDSVIEIMECIHGLVYQSGVPVFLVFTWHDQLPLKEKRERGTLTERFLDKFSGKGWMDDIYDSGDNSGEPPTSENLTPEGDQMQTEASSENAEGPSEAGEEQTRDTPEKPKKNVSPASKLEKLIENYRWDEHCVWSPAKTGHPFVVESEALSHVLVLRLVSSVLHAVVQTHC